MTDYVQIVSTFPKRDEAEAAAAELVDRALVACAQVQGPILSVYRWEGETERTEEYCLTVKTRLDRFAAVEAAILELSPYETPEILALPVVAAHEKYLRWIDAHVKQT